jgi:hypothetical protein
MDSVATIESAIGISIDNEKHPVIMEEVFGKVANDNSNGERGWDACFIPDLSNDPFAEFNGLSLCELGNIGIKCKLSHRYKALKKLEKYVLNLPKQQLKSLRKSSNHYRTLEVQLRDDMNETTNLEEKWEFLEFETIEAKNIDYEKVIEEDNSISTMISLGAREVIECGRRGRRSRNEIQLEDEESSMRSSDYDSEQNSITEIENTSENNRFVYASRQIFELYLKIRDSQMKISLSDGMNENTYNIALTDLDPYSRVVNKIGRDFGQFDPTISRMDEFAIATIRKCFPEVTTNRTESEVKHMVEKWYRWKLMMKHKLCRRWTKKR